MSESFRPVVEHLREAAGLTSGQFLEKFKCPVLLWPQTGEWMEDTPFQFETYEGEYSDEEVSDISSGTESQVGRTLVVEIRKQTDTAQVNVVCVGRAANNDIVLANHTVSKLHTYFVVLEDETSYEIVDANSTNGTMVNNKRLVAYQNHPLFNGDQIKFGPSIQMMYLTPQGFYDLLRHLPRSGIS